MTTVRNESMLPTRNGSFQYFIRSISIPTVLIEGHSGECFQREDGQRWQHPALERSTDRDGNWDALTPRGAWFDDAVYPYRTKAAA